MNVSKSIKSILFISLGLFISTGCNKNFLNVNNNPNNLASSAASPALIFTGAETLTAQIINGGDFLELQYPMSYDALSTNYQVSYTITRNNYTSADFSGVWSDCYHNLTDYYTVEQVSSANGFPFLVAAAKTMEALDFQMLVDGYGNVPYSQAIQLPDGIVNPGYDSAQVIYTALLAKLDSAIGIFESDSVLAAGSYNPGTADIMFGGNPTSWVQFANTLKLRLLLHEINVTGQATTIAAEAAKIAADPNGCLGAGQTAAVNPGYATDNSGHLSPLWSTYGYTITLAAADPDQTANSYMINLLAGFSDPRAPYFYASNSSGQVIGNPWGLPTVTTATYVGSGNTNTSPLNLSAPFGTDPTLQPALYGLTQIATQSAIVLSSWESLFLQAEAIQRGLLPGGAAAAETDYEQAITDDFTYLNVYTDGVTVGNPASSYATAYYSQSLPNVGWAASTNKLQAIITQKYISLCLTNVEEAWTDFRRTGYPSSLPFSTDPAVVYPRINRFIYPQSEYNANAAQVALQGTVTPALPLIFWMQ